jgi:hypothetical protein
MTRQRVMSGIANAGDQWLDLDGEYTKRIFRVPQSFSLHFPVEVGVHC